MVDVGVRSCEQILRSHKHHLTRLVAHILVHLKLERSQIAESCVESRHGDISLKFPVLGQTTPGPVDLSRQRRDQSIFATDGNLVEKCVSSAENRKGGDGHGEVVAQVEGFGGCGDELGCRDDPGAEEWWRLDLRCLCVSRRELTETSSSFLSSTLLSVLSGPRSKAGCATERVSM